MQQQQRSWNFPVVARIDLSVVGMQPRRPCRLLPTAVTTFTPWRIRQIPASSFAINVTFCCFDVTAFLVSLSLFFFLFRRQIFLFYPKWRSSTNLYHRRIASSWQLERYTGIIWPFCYCCCCCLACTCHFGSRGNGHIALRAAWPRPFPINISFLAYRSYRKKKDRP